MSNKCPDPACMHAFANRDKLTQSNFSRNDKAVIKLITGVCIEDKPRVSLSSGSFSLVTHCMCCKLTGVQCVSNKHIEPKPKSQLGISEEAKSNETPRVSNIQNKKRMLVSQAENLSNLDRLCKAEMLHKERK